jgi:2-polyprenyl-3-methyl-5-hydroxy-6-metoxy-1,4-benzoquinol methylase
MGDDDINQEYSAAAIAIRGPGHFETDWRVCLKPERPHDELSFDELERHYNFQKTSVRSNMIVRLVLNELRERSGPTRVLDIGAGQGISQNIILQQAIAEHCDELWGIEPDKRINRTDGIFANYQHAMMETAELPDNSFDIAYAFLVMEHVADPDAFLSKVQKCLKPGGVFIFMTPNKKHYFTIIANTLKVLKLDEITLRLLVGKQILDEYHYPVTYRFNSVRQINSVSQRVGMAPPRYAYLETEGPRSYMKGPLILVFYVLKFKRSIIKNPKILLDLVGRITKPLAND